MGIIIYVQKLGFWNEMHEEEKMKKSEDIGEKRKKIVKQGYWSSDRICQMKKMEEYVTRGG